MLFSSSVMPNSLWPHGLQHTRLPCLLLSPEVCSNPCLLSSDVIQPSHLLTPPSPPALNHSSIRVFSNEPSLHIRWPKYWSFSFSISSSNKYSELISFRTEWFDLAVQGILKRLLQNHNSKASVLWCSTFFMVQLSHPYMTTGKNHSLDYMELCWQNYFSAF